MNGGLVNHFFQFLGIFIEGVFRVRVPQNELFSLRFLALQGNCMPMVEIVGLYHRGYLGVGQELRLLPSFILGLCLFIGFQEFIP